MPLILILAECGIEIIPKKIRGHPSVKSNLNTKNYACQLLDTALHHVAMNNLPNSQKRGRPDILHLCLLNALGSPLNKSGNLSIFVHTVKDKIFEFNSEIKITRNYNRFKGLIAKLLIDEKIDFDGKELIAPFNGDLDRLISNYENPDIFLLTSKGRLSDNLEKLYVRDISKNTIIIIGGFQKSGFSDKILNLSQNKVSISNYSLDAWVAVYRVISYYEIIHRII